VPHTERWPDGGPIAKEFKQTPKTILLSFALDAGTTAQATAPTAAN
jgi:hypothetical protein